MQKMAQDSTPVLRESLEKCFIEQQLALKQLTVQYEDLEDKVELVDCFYTQLDGNQEENRGNLEKLEKRVTKLEGHLGKLEDRVEIIDKGDDKRLDLLEERVAVLNTQNIELRDHLNLTIDTVNNVRDHLNLTIDMVNNVTTILKNQYGNKEQTETTTPHEDIKDEDMCEDTQPTVQQVFAMYQSQPPDEEGWDEMTSAIEAAEEREARKKVNGLTKDQWQDLLHLK